ncbi:hypothetical protein DV515_00000103 [Chloebia gouldiae]|uniref:Uncharacterized protein n=1 Tax=Chloebia gouldiae TaxID=44316 RepID=A0A3L8T0T2_CHLGU|nr:hypothetical protein DV515_00000103 [Chloebia gouldiae]
MRRLQDRNKMKFLVLNVLATAERMEAVRLGVTHLRTTPIPPAPAYKEVQTTAPVSSSPSSL